MAATPVKTFTKSPNGILDYPMRWRDWLKGDTIASAPVITADVGLTVASSPYGGDTVIIWISGGADGTTYNVTVKILTVGGRTVERTFAIRVALT